jgi:hypothetical protein
MISFACLIVLGFNHYARICEFRTVSNSADCLTEVGYTPQTVCFPAVSVAYRLVVDLLKETSQSEGP